MSLNMLLDGFFMAGKMVKNYGFISNHFSVVHQRDVYTNTFTHTCMDTHTWTHTHKYYNDSNRRMQRAEFRLMKDQWLLVFYKNWHSQLDFEHLYCRFVFVVFLSGLQLTLDIRLRHVTAHFVGLMTIACFCYFGGSNLSP